MTRRRKEIDERRISTSLRGRPRKRTCSDTTCAGSAITGTMATMITTATILYDHDSDYDSNHDRGDENDEHNDDDDRH
jgi:hypothetical protein